MSACPIPEQNPSRASLSLDSTVESINLVERTAYQFAQSAGFCDGELDNISLAAREAAANAVLHGNRKDASKKLAISLETTAQALTIRVADQGSGFNPDSVPNPVAPENILRQCGRGIFLIRTFVDELHFRALHPGTELTLIKYRRSNKKECCS
jgi:serine/threonine-protein kinase RsbW